MNASHNCKSLSYVVNGENDSTVFILHASSALFALVTMAVRCVGPKSCLSVWEEDLSAHARLSDAVCLNGVCGRQRERNERLCRRLENP